MTAFWQEVLQRPREVFGKLSRGQRFGVLALASVGIVVAVLASLLAGRQSWAMLYGSLESQDASAIIQKLQENAVPYQLSPDGTLIQVPEARIGDVKLLLAGAGLPRAGARGFELFDGNQLGITDALFNVNLQRAKQGELERIIETCDAVQRARVLVHLQAPSLYARNAARTTASVMLWLRPGAPLSDSNVAAIAHVVARGVGYGMQPNDVAITDSQPRLLYPRGDGDNPLLSLEYLQKVQSIEEGLREKAESALRQALGEGKAVVRVSVELDLTYKEQRREQLDEANRVPVKEITSKHSTGGSGSDPSAVALSTAPTGGSSIETDEEGETHYREGVTQDLSITGAGDIKRMTVSLLLDDSDPTVKAAETKLGDAVKSAVGFNQKRDVFTTASLPFAKAAAPAEAPGPFALENLLPLAGYLAEAVTVLFVLVLLVKFARGGRAGETRGRVKVRTNSVGVEVVQADGMAPVEEDLELDVADPKGPDMRTRLGRFVEKHPDQAREVLVAWLREEMAA